MNEHYKLGLDQGAEAAEDFWTDYYPEFPGQDVESLIDQYRSDLIFAEHADLMPPDSFGQAWAKGFKEAIMKAKPQRNPQHPRELSRDAARKGGAIAGRSTVFTPILVTEREGPGERQAMRLSPEDMKKITRGPGPKGIVTDQKTGKQYAVWGRDCGLPGCFCDAEVMDMHSGLFTPILVTKRGGSGKRMNMRLSPEDEKKITRGHGFKGTVTDLKTGKQYKVWGRSCGLASCVCDAEAMLIKTSKPAKKSKGKKPAKQASRPAKVKTGKPVTDAEIRKTITKANRMRTRIIKANQVTKPVGFTWGVPPYLTLESKVVDLLAWLYAFLGPHSFPVSKAAKSLNLKAPTSKATAWKWISVVLQPKKSDLK